MWSLRIRRTISSILLKAVSTVFTDIMQTIMHISNLSLKKLFFKSCKTHTVILIVNDKTEDFKSTLSWLLTKKDNSLKHLFAFILIFIQFFGLQFEPNLIHSRIDVGHFHADGTGGITKSPVGCPRRKGRDFQIGLEHRWTCRRCAMSCHEHRTGRGRSWPHYEAKHFLL